VRLGGEWAEVEELSDLLVGVAVGDELHDFAFARCEELQAAHRRRIWMGCSGRRLDVVLASVYCGRQDGA
jgi:hypothetical protein